MVRRPFLWFALSLLLPRFSCRFLTAASFEYSKMTSLMLWLLLDASLFLFSDGRERPFITNVRSPVSNGITPPGMIVLIFG